MRALTEDIFVETKFAGCNVGFVTTREGIVMVDAPMRPSQALKWREEITRRGKLLYLINTEHHRDHTFGSYFFPATVISHQRTRELVRDAINLEEIRKSLETTDPGGLPALADYEVRLPTITFWQGLTLHMGNYDLELLTRPGHLPHSVMVRIPQAGAIFAGDNFVNGLYPWFQECMVLSWLETLKEIKQMDIDTIVPGHGDVCTKEAVAQLEGYINQVIEEVRTAIERGWSREETADRASFPPPWPVNSGLESRLPWAHRAGIMRIYNELRKGPEEPGQTNLLGRP